jgi:hypothetical protein
MRIYNGILLVCWQNDASCTRKDRSIYQDIPINSATETDDAGIYARSEHVNLGHEVEQQFTNDQRGGTYNSAWRHGIYFWIIRN